MSHLQVNNFYKSLLIFPVLLPHKLVCFLSVLCLFGGTNKRPESSGPRTLICDTGDLVSQLCVRQMAYSRSNSSILTNQLNFVGVMLRDYTPFSPYFECKHIPKATVLYFSLLKVRLFICLGATFGDA